MPAARASITSWESSATACVGREGDVGTASERGTDIGYTVEDAGTALPTTSITYRTC